MLTMKKHVDPVVAGRDALATVGADLRPTLRIRRPLAAGEQVEDTLDDSRRIGRTVAHIDPRRSATIETLQHRRHRPTASPNRSAA
jgi:hypothetical protein